MSNTTEREKLLENALLLFSQLSKEGQVFLLAHFDAVINHDIQALENLKESAPDSEGVKLLDKSIEYLKSKGVQA